jgi:hypothetical protein
MHASIVACLLLYADYVCRRFYLEMRWKESKAKLSLSSLTSCSLVTPPWHASSPATKTLAGPGGRYGNAMGITSALGCTLCPRGSYCAPGSVISTLCPAGTFGSATGLSTSACSGLCLAASPGAYCGSGASFSSSSTQCPAGTFSNSSNVLQCTLCPAGTFGSSLSLTTAACSGLCSAGPGAFCPAGATSAQGVSCPPGTFSASGSNSSSCDDCPAGFACPLAGTTTPTPCAAGWYSGPSAVACNTCPAGRFAATPASSACSGPCEPASPGYFVCGPAATSANSSSPCPVGQYSDVSNATVCKPCAPGTSVSPGVTGLTSSNCSGLCAPGQFSYPNATCISCPAGYFQDAWGAWFCFPCPAGVSQVCHRVCCVDAST